MNNKVISVRVNVFNKKYVQQLFNCPIPIRHARTMLFIKYLCDRFKIEQVIVCISLEPGISCYYNNIIYIYDSCKLNDADYFDILIKCFMKHYDKNYLKLKTLISDEYYYKRVQNLKSKLIDGTGVCS